MGCYLYVKLYITNVSFVRKMYVVKLEIYHHDRKYKYFEIYLKVINKDRTVLNLKYLNKFSYKRKHNGSIST